MHHTLGYQVGELEKALQQFMARTPYDLTQRARKYLLNKWVYFVKGTQDAQGLHLHGSVIGSMVYSASFTLISSDHEASFRLQHYCNCPQGQNGVLCEHVVALGAELKSSLDEGGLDIDADPEGDFASIPQAVPRSSLSQGLKRIQYYRDLLSEFHQALYTRPVHFLQDYISLVDPRRMSVEVIRDRFDLKLAFFAERVGKRGNTLKTSPRRVRFSEIVKYQDPVFSQVQTVGYPENPDSAEGKLVVTSIFQMMKVFCDFPRFYWDKDREPVRFGPSLELEIRPALIQNQDLLKIHFINRSEGISIPFEQILLRGPSASYPYPALYGRAPDLGICCDGVVYPVKTPLSKERILSLVHYLGQIPLNQLTESMKAHLFEEILSPLVGGHLHLNGPAFSLSDHPTLVEPVAIFQLDSTEGMHELRVLFRYGKKEIAWVDRREQIIDHDQSTIYARNWEYEKQVIEVFESGCHMQMIEGMNPVYLDHPMIMEILDFLYNAKKPIMTGERVVIRLDERLRASVPKKARIRVDAQSGVDWFEIQLRGECGGEEISPIVLKRILEEKKKYVEVDGAAFKVDSRLIQQINRYLDRYRTDAREEAEDASLRFQIPWYEQQILERLPSELFESDERYLSFQKGFWNLDQVPAYPIPDSFQGSLRSYQIQGYRWLRFLEEYGLHGVLADDMGLGKTIQTICLMAARKESTKSFKALVVAPLSVLDNWARELSRFTPSIRVVKYHGAQRSAKKINHSSVHVVVTSYALLRQDIDIFLERKWDYLILDEAQFIKNKATATFRQIRKVPASNRVALSGTPIENTPRDIKGIFDFLMPGFLGSDRRFEQDYLRDLPRMQEKIRPFILRRKKDEVLKELPPKTIENLFIDMPPPQESMYKERYAEAKREIESMLADQSSLHKHHWKILTHLIRLRQLACHCGILNPSMTGSEYSGKIQALDELLEGICSEGHKVLVFSQFAQMVDLISRHLKGQRKDHLVIHGGVRNRSEIIQQFNENEDQQILLLTLKVGGLGLNLTRASYVVLFDPWWNPATEIQAIDRTHRIGQTRPVNVYRLFSTGTIEEKVLQLQERKLKWASEVLDYQTAQSDMEYIEQLRSLL